MVIVHMVLLTHSVAPARNSFLAPIVQEFIFIFVHMVRLWLPPRFSVPASSAPIGQIFLLVAQVFLQLPVLGSLLRFWFALHFCHSVSGATPTASIP
jgi:hypothetical protein